MELGVRRETELPHLVREPAGEPEGAIVLLHGRATSEADLHPLIDALDPERRLLGLTPGAPLTGIPPGGRHWYVIEEVGQPDVETFVESMGQAANFVDDFLRQRGIAWEDTMIGGFSQGGAVSLALALGTGRPRPAGILAMSCFLPMVRGWRIDVRAKRGTPAYLTHGDLRQHHPGRLRAPGPRRAGRGRARRDLPRDPGPASIDPELLPEMRAWLLARTGGPDPVRDGPKSKI